jgi:hypothetical protein
VSPEDFIRVLTQHAYHWSEADIWLPRADLLRFFDDFAGSFPLLKRLQVFDTDPGFDLPPCSFSSLKPCLELRELLTDHSILSPIPDGIPWAQLTRFEAYDLSALTASEILRLAPVLEECTLEFDFDTLDDVSFNPPIGVLPHLRCLRLLGGTREYHDHGIFDLVTLPALQELKLQLENDNVPRFLSLVSRSSCYLTDLRVHCDMDESHFIQCLTALPHLAQLCVTQWQSILPLDTIAKNLHHRYRYLPRLETLRFNSYEDAPSIDYRILVEMLASRRNMDDKNSPQLAVFRLNLLSSEPRDPDADIIQFCEGLLANGLQITIENANGMRFYVRPSS